jgi:hypothetical protein
MRIAFFPLLLGLVVLAACGTNEAPASSTGSDCHGSKDGRAVTDADKAKVVRKSDDCEEENERRGNTCADRRNRIGNAVKAFQVVSWRHKADRLEARGEAIEERMTARAEELRAGARCKAKEVAKAVAVNRD